MTRYRGHVDDERKTTMKEKPGIASYLAVAGLTFSAWALALSSVAAIFLIVPSFAESFNDFDVQLPALVMYLVDLSEAPLYAPLLTAMAITSIAALALILGWYHRKPIIILAVIANILVIILAGTCTITLFVTLTNLIESTSS
jgi:type II secretory pathway component PulF